MIQYLAQRFSHYHNHKKFSILSFLKIFRDYKNMHTSTLHKMIKCCTSSLYFSLLTILFFSHSAILHKNNQELKGLSISIYSKASLSILLFSFYIILSTAESNLLCTKDIFFLSL